METPFGGPAMVSPRHLASPEDGAIRPAMMRSSVDLPDPERPSRPTISPEWIVRSTFSRTSSSSPLPFGNERQTPRISSRLASLASIEHGFSLRSAEAKTALSEGVERPPEQPVEQRHQNAHHGDAEHDAREIAGFGRIALYRHRGRLAVRWVSPQLATSATMEAFHDPPEAVIAPVM